MATLLEGQSVSSVAKEYDISKVTVSNWKKAVAEGIHEDRTQKRDGGVIGDLLLELLEKTIRSLVAISENSFRAR